MPTAEPEEPNFQDEIRRQRKCKQDKMLTPYLETLLGAQTDMMRENVLVFKSVQPPMEEEEEPSNNSLLLSPPLNEVPSSHYQLAPEH